MGSPPPTRGTQSETTCSKIEQGITPAYAGNTYTLLLCCPSTRDHPRLRGEHLFRSVHLPFQPGSPPPTRGTQELFTSNAIDFGITPAYAGNTSFFISFSFTKWDHPRLRGEHSASQMSIKYSSGSPPPTRGTPLSVSFIKSSTGITPAYAGNTNITINYLLQGRDHPRLRGEHIKRNIRKHYGVGSPPPTRGTPMFGKHQSTEFRITPAYAGNTISFTKYHHQDQDHPRLRGEHLLAKIDSLEIMGSPPPTRGTLV